MKAPLSWLNKYVDISMAPEELAHELTMVGIEVGSVNLIGDKWGNNLVIGGVEEIVQHPGGLEPPGRCPATTNPTGTATHWRRRRGWANARRTGLHDCGVLQGKGLER